MTSTRKTESSKSIQRKNDDRRKRNRKKSDSRFNPDASSLFAAGVSECELYRLMKLWKNDS